MNKNSILYTVIFAFFSTFVLVVPLALANEGTKPIVAENQKLAASKAILGALGIDVIPLDKKAILERYAQLERLRKVNGTWQVDTSLPAESVNLLYRLVQADGSMVYGRFYAGPALWGTVIAAIGFSDNGTRITGLRIYSQVETPGLGSRIEEPWYTSQFTGQATNGPLSLNAIVSPKGDLEKNDADIDGVSGATRSSEGIRNIVNAAIADIKIQIAGVQP